MDGHLRVGRLGRVRVANSTAIAHHRPRQLRHAEAEPHQVGPVDVAIADVAVARFPKPVPVIMNQVVFKGVSGSRSLPQVPIKPGRDDRRRGLARAFAAIENHRLVITGRQKHQPFRVGGLVLGKR